MINETKRKATWQELADRVDELQKKLDNSISKDNIREKKDYYHNIAFERKDVKSIKITQALAIYKAMCDLLKEE